MSTRARASLTADVDNWTRDIFIARLAEYNSRDVAFLYSLQRCCFFLYADAGGFKRIGACACASSWYYFVIWRGRVIAKESFGI